MILTVTLNPAIDKTIELSDFKIGGLNKVTAIHQDPAGKGINVSKVVKSLGGESLATGILAGNYIESALDVLGIRHDFVKVDGETRTNLKIFDAITGETTELNEQGPIVNVASVESLLSKIEALQKTLSMVVLSGSAPKSLPKTVYQSLIKEISSMGLKVFLDAEGELFMNGIKSKPFAIKPNRHELELYFKEPLRSSEALSRAAHHFQDQGISQVYISLGSEGAYYLGDEGEYYLKPLKIDVNSSVGAGDAFVGAIAYATEKALPVEQRLKLAVATSAGAVTTVGTKPVGLKWVEEHLQMVELVKVF